jgi:hypothetical protein
MPAKNDRGLREALIKRAEGLLEECSIQHAPVNLIRIARHVGIQCIRELDVRLDGQLFQLDDGSYEVILSSQAPQTRKRFTLAHEIGHVLVAADHNGQMPCGEGPTEELCNTVAAELLLPRRFLSEFLTEKIDVSAIRRIATKFQCSLEATGWRILNLGAIKGVLLIWRDLGEHSMELVAAPRTYGFPAPFRSGDVVGPTSPIIETVSGADAGHVAFEEQKSRRSYTGDYMRLNTMVLMFLQTTQLGVGEVRDREVGDWVQGRLF